MNTAKKHLLISLAIFAVAFLSVTIYIGANASGAFKTVSDAAKTPEPVIEPVQSSPEIPNKSNEATESAPVAPENVETYQQPSQPQITPQAQPQPQMERIPFTNKPVKSGNPESYVDTYGQCPFYENAGPKGCFPPPDIECNADWSKCEYTGDVK